MSLLYTDEQKELIAMVREMAEMRLSLMFRKQTKKANVPGNCLTGALGWGSICWRFPKNLAEPG